MEIDAEGNVTGVRRGGGNGRMVCVAAHLDTVFPQGTEVTVRREAPGCWPRASATITPYPRCCWPGCAR